VDKISVTLYDLLGYILPGCILLFTASLVEAIFAGSHHLSLSAMTANLALSAVACYFLGAVAHSTGSILKDRFPNSFSDKKNRLDPSILGRAKEMAKGLYGFTGEDERDLTTLEIYLLADSYVIASGKTVEREVLQAREGFYKASMVAMAALSIAFFFAAIFGGAVVQFGAKSVEEFSRLSTLLLGLMGLLLTLVFRRGFRFFNRVKINNTILLFMALWSLGGDRKQKGS